MHESEEKSTHRLPMPLPKIKHGEVDDMEVEDAAEEQAEEELGDNTKADEAPLDQQQMQVHFERFAVHQDELARRQQM